jgi:hypothetical protein
VAWNTSVLDHPFSDKGTGKTSLDTPQLSEITKVVFPNPEFLGSLRPDFCHYALFVKEGIQDFRVRNDTFHFFVPFLNK